MPIFLLLPTFDGDVVPAIGVLVGVLLSRDQQRLRPRDPTARGTGYAGRSRVTDAEENPDE